MSSEDFLLANLLITIAKFETHFSAKSPTYLQETKL